MLEKLRCVEACLHAYHVLLAHMEILPHPATHARLDILLVFQVLLLVQPVQLIILPAVSIVRRVFNALHTRLQVRDRRFARVIPSILFKMEAVPHVPLANLALMLLETYRTHAHFVRWALFHPLPHHRHVPNVLLISLRIK